MCSVTGGYHPLASIPVFTAEIQSVALPGHDWIEHTGTLSMCSSVIALHAREILMPLDMDSDSGSELRLWDWKTGNVLMVRAISQILPLTNYK